MSGPKIRALVAALAIAAAAHVLAAPANVIIRLSTIAPQESTWHKALNEMGAAWSRDTADRVKLRVFAGGTDGGEEKIIKSMRPEVGDNEAALLMVTGLSQIDKAFTVFTMPFFFQSDEEEAYVQQKLTPMFAQRLEAQGYHLLNWGSGGWIQVFSRTQLKTLADVKKAKLFTSQGDNPMVAWYTQNGFRPVQWSSNDIGQGLGSGALDAVPISPYAVVALKLYQSAKFMLDLHVAPLMGATIVTNGTWKKIAPEDQAKMTTAAQAMEAKLLSGATKQDDDSVVAMQAKGLTVLKLDKTVSDQFHAEAEKMLATMRGTIVPEDVYKAAVDARDAYRKSKGK